MRFTSRVFADLLERYTPLLLAHPECWKKQSQAEVIEAHGHF